MRTARCPLPMHSGNYLSGGCASSSIRCRSPVIAHPDQHELSRQRLLRDRAQVQFEQQMHSDLPHKTLLRGYVQLNYGTDGTRAEHHPVRTRSHTLAPSSWRRKIAPFASSSSTSCRSPARRMHSARTATCSSLSTRRSWVQAWDRWNHVLPEPQRHPPAWRQHPWISDGTPHQWTTPAGEAPPIPRA